MKKALVVFLALAMIAGVFADEPVAESSIAGFSGNASVTWGVDLDSKKTGFKNDASADFKVTLAKGGSKTSAGDGVWGEIKIEAKDLKIENAEIKDGKAEVKEAKLHLDPVTVGIMKGDTKVGGYNAPRALNYEKNAKVDAVNESKEHGIVIQYSAGDIFSIDVDFRSAEKYNDDYGVAAEITSKPIAGLEVKAGYSMAFASKAMGLGAKVEYNMPIGDAGMYIMPGLGYSSTLASAGAFDAGKLAVGVLFGFSGDSGDNAGLPLFDNDFSGKAKAGVSVATALDLGNTAVIPLYFDVWTGSSLVPNLGAAACFRTDDLSNIGTNFVTGAGVKYAISVDPATITPQVGFIMANTTSLKLKGGVVVGGAVDNTTFELWYTSGEFKASPAGLGTIDLTCKISI
jgi:hypothetical protein